MRIYLLIILFMLGSGCSKSPNDPADPYEKFNRKVFAFNMRVDHAIYRPIARTYTTITPPPLQKGISNVFTNLGMVTTIPNDILQGKFKYTVVDLWRLIINSTVGVGGLFDVASRLNIPLHHEDFSMTLAYYSRHKQPTYLIVPFLGPTTAKGIIAEPVDYFTTPWPILHPESVRYSLIGLKTTDLRASLMPTNKILDNAFDPYALMRSAYLQKRTALIDNNNQDYQSQR